ncbi:hypothetical protein [Sphingomonas sp. Leaf25]|uniref:hypothetical protein n=1 Tax=Sphingomonas sp. Leaf25 TaxID=1735692 RepID=UPI0006FB519D|nr:hypothetical protein [Sphingomonas sp. Leaf25]KQM96600.1 hypothetical protein ASE78_11465 [Sphingomonas sp. Leaf25]
MRFIRSAALAAILLATGAAAAPPIDRAALVARHAVRLTAIDPWASVMLGNGSLGFTADVTGLQTYPQAYAKPVPLLTMAQWAWHRAPNPKGYRPADGMVGVPVPGRGVQPYAYIADFAEVAKRPALGWLRENPHRFALGRLSLRITTRDGRQAPVSALTAIDQRLDLWTGTLTSRFRFDGAVVRVETRVDPARDIVAVRVRSPLVASGRIALDTRYPGVGASLNPDPQDWEHDEAHRTEVIEQAPGMVRLRRTIDATRYQASLQVAGGTVTRIGPHGFRAAAPGQGELIAQAGFEAQERPLPRLDATATARAVADHWRRYWQAGGVIDFSGSTDPRAGELERRVVLSQYLSAINSAGTLLPQEDGLFSNSWNGKFHLEMHAWHSAHFAAWGRPALLERSMGWYLAHLPQAEARARTHGVEGAWWPKMTGPDGEESPSPINPFIMWQQPHPIYLAEMLYRAGGGRAALDRYGALVDRTAALLASWPRRVGDRLVLGPPIVPVQENHPPLTTTDPTFEIAYFRWGLETAQAWRVRRGLGRRADWDRAIAALPPLPQADGRYLPVATAPGFWRTAASAPCSGHAMGPDCLNRDHPSFLMAHGLIGGGGVDQQVMRATLAGVRDHWDLRQTWGWDYPMIAMTAARLGDRAGAVGWLFSPQANNRWGPTGLTPRVELAPGEQGPDGMGTKRVAALYVPSNGSLLLAVGMMAAGWDGSVGPTPGFPKQGWRVRVAGVRPLP